MNPSLGETHIAGQDRPPSLPTHSLEEKRISSDEHREYLKEKYEEADRKLCRLEEELEVLLHCALLCREQRTELAQGLMEIEYQEYPIPPRRKIEGDQIFLDDYLKLLDKDNALRDAIKTQKEECRAARMECTYLFAKYRRYLSSGFKEFKNEWALHKDTILGDDGRIKWQRLLWLDGLGSMDRETGAEFMMDLEREAATVGAVVGGLGVGITFTTLFSATRGRLDLIACSFACFIFTLFFSAMLQSLVQPRHLEIKIWARYTLGGQRARLAFRVAFLALPVLAGIVLLALAVLLLDGRSEAVVPGSQSLIRVSGCVPLVWIGFCAATAIAHAKVRGFLFRRKSDISFPTAGNETLAEGKMEKHFPSHFLPKDHRWRYLPGGSDYFTYRKWRSNHLVKV